MQTSYASQPCDNNRAPHPALRKTRTPRRRTAARQRGFALIVTVSLMVLLAIMTVGLLSLSTISLRGAAQSMAQADAQANARLALMMAIAELQKEMGPDQRISAPGGQLLEESDKSARKHWTGVYESWPAASEIRPAPVFRRWLISGNESVTTSRTSVTSGDSLAIPAANFDPGIVTLVPGDLDNDPVEAGLVPTENGSYAWWVADENTKAKLGGRVEKPALVDQNIARMQAAPRANHEVFFTGNTATPDAPELDRIVSTKTVSLLGDTDRTYFHDMTASATGLVTNVRTGGFKKDLNFFLDRPRTVVPATPALYSVGSSQGINWQELWRDFNVWGEIEYPSSPPQHQDGSSMPPSVPTLVRLPNGVSARDDSFLYYRTPTRLQTMLICSLVAEKVIVGSKPRFDLYLVMDPIVWLWNPFNVTVHLPRSVFDSYKLHSFPYDLRLNLSGGTGGDRTFEGTIRSLLVSNDANFMVAQIGRQEPITLRPGEVQIQSQGFRQPIVTIDGKKAWHDNKLGWDFGSGYRYLINYMPEKDRDGSHKITYSMKPNNQQANDYGLVLNGHAIKNTDRDSDARPIGSHVINFMPGKQGTKIFATSFPKIFPSIPEEPSNSRTVEQLANGDKWPICVFTFGMAAENDPGMTQGTRTTARYLRRVNPKSIAYDLFNLDPAIVRAAPLQLGMRAPTGLSAVGVECDAKGFGYFGGSYSENDGVSYLVTHHVPTKPIHSLGALQHSLADGGVLGPGYGPGTTGENAAAARLLPSLSHSIANSIAPSVMSPSSVRSTLGGRPAADHSYLANLALWDDWFFSSISPETVPAYKNRSTANTEQKNRFEAFITGREKLPNTRFIAAPVDPETALKELFPSANNRPAADAHWRSAANLLVDGAFNVNSVSVVAWRAFLSGLKGEDVAVRETPASSATPELIATTDTPVPGLVVPSGREIPDGSLDNPKNPEQWTGFRSLTDYQIEELANAIVKQVRLRGPFTSLADFVNRRPGNDKDLALSGAIQSALDDPDVSINEGYRSGSRALPAGSASGNGNPESEAGPKAVGAPGYVKQGDILTAIAPLITVRGDTFLVRAYGDARDKSGNIIARAWCEAVVRRMPEYVDPADPAVPKTLPSEWTQPPPAPQVPANLTFGRRMEIVSIRWLAPEEA